MIARELNKYQNCSAQYLNNCPNQKPHCKKSLAIFSSPAGMSPIKLSMARNNYSPLGEISVSDIPAGDGKIAKNFLQCAKLSFPRLFEAICGLSL